MRDRIASLVMRLLALTWRIRLQGTLPPKQCVVAFWHGEMLPVWFTMRCLSPTAMVSASKDGGILTQLLLDWKYGVVRGSSSQGGSEALAAITAAAQQGVVCVTPDGPRGPRHQMKPGAVIAAHRAAVPLVLVRARIHGKKVFERSWDRFELPLPFARVDIFIDEPLTIPADADREEIDRFIAMTQERLMQLGGG